MYNEKLIFKSKEKLTFIFKSRIRVDFSYTLMKTLEASLQKHYRDFSMNCEMSTDNFFQMFILEDFFMDNLLQGAL